MKGKLIVGDDMIPTDEQVKEFWELCGFSSFPSQEQRYISYPSHSLHSRYKTRDVLEYVPVTKWTYPGGRSLSSLPPIDLNNLFKYAVPKDAEVRLRPAKNTSNKRYCCLILDESPWEVDAFGETDELALFWVIYNTIKSEKPS